MIRVFNIVQMRFLLWIISGIGWLKVGKWRKFTGRSALGILTRKLSILN